MSKKEQQIVEMMKALEISREEAEELVAFDNEEFELEEVKEMTEKAKKADKGTKRGRPTGTKMAGVTQQTRKKKENPTKARIIEIIEKALQAEGIAPSVPNKEKTILFELDGHNFEIDLKQKRVPKTK